MMLDMYKQMTVLQLKQLNLAEIWAEDLYRRAMRRSWWRRLYEGVFSKKRRLISLKTQIGDRAVVGRYNAGLQQVSLSQIYGSESAGRGNDFDGRFRPHNPRLRQCWLKVAQARYQDVSLPPVELIQVDDRYFVRDGHHRVSVAGALGQETILAHVLVISLDPAAATGGRLLPGPATGRIHL